MVLASLSNTALALVLGGYLMIVVLIFLLFPRDVTGRKRATGCLVGLVLLFGLILWAFASWASTAIF